MCVKKNKKSKKNQQKQNRELCRKELWDKKQIYKEIKQLSAWNKTYTNNYIVNKIKNDNCIKKLSNFIK